MRFTRALALVGAFLLPDGSARRADLPVVKANPNIERAGTLRNGVLTVALEAKRSLWRLDGERRPGMSIAAFAEDGKSPLIPGPLVRVARGTELRVSVRNSLRTAITFYAPSAIRGGRAAALDSVVVAPGAVGRWTARAAIPGTYLYRATTPTTASAQQLVGGLLAGAIVIDSAGVTAPPPDRVFVMLQTPDSVAEANADSANTLLVTIGRLMFTINGLSWPRTERIAATAGDSLHWRIINATNETHPMHLHGFYFRVDALSGALVERDGQGALRRVVVTERMPAFSAMSIAWLADRSGNWIFHCHFAAHIAPTEPVDHANVDHAASGMAGLVLGINVADRPGHPASVFPARSRRLRLIAISDPGFPDSEPSLRFVLEDRGRRLDGGTAFSPTIELTRGEPVSIMVVNHLTEATAVHWHGIELESYNDGVAGVSGSGVHLAPIIAPRDSFEARFTPPRSGTFIYHSHVDEVRQHTAGLVGAIIVRDAGVFASPDDHVFFLKGARHPTADNEVEINGRTNPDTVVLHAGHATRLRFISLAPTQANARFILTERGDSAVFLARDTMTVRWYPIAKDGADLPDAARAGRPARQTVSMGETYDFAYTPSRPGTLRLEVRAAAGHLLVRVPIRVE